MREILFNISFDLTASLDMDGNGTADFPEKPIKLKDAIKTVARDENVD
jgi:hypothetical protein